MTIYVHMNILTHPLRSVVPEECSLLGTEVEKVKNLTLQKEANTSRL